MTEFNWTAPAVDELRTLWASGATAPVCVNVLVAKFGGFLSRSSVISKIHRIGLAGRAASTPRPTWCADVVAELKRLHADGNTSQACADILTEKFDTPISRKAVNRKLDRLGLVARRKPGRPAIGETPTTAATSRVWRASSPPSMPRTLPASAIPVEQRKTLIELGNEHCRWPYGEPTAADFFFCGSPTADLSGRRPYCPVHELRAHARTSSPSIADGGEG